MFLGHDYWGYQSSLTYKDVGLGLVVCLIAVRWDINNLFIDKGSFIHESSFGIEKQFQGRVQKPLLPVVRPRVLGLPCSHLTYEDVA